VGSGRCHLGTRCPAHRVCLPGKYCGRRGISVRCLPPGESEHSRAALDGRVDRRRRHRTASPKHSTTAEGNREPFRAAGDEHHELMTLIAVLGAGSWGTTLANLLAGKGDEVRIWAYEPEVVEAINHRHENPVFLPGIPLAPALRAYGDAGEAVADA